MLEGTGFYKWLKKHKHNPLKHAKKEFDVDMFKRLVHEFHEEQDKLQALLPLERAKYLEEKRKLMELLRGEEAKRFPIIVKASSAGTLETLLLEA
jgi:hypothetical protein